MSLENFYRQITIESSSPHVPDPAFTLQVRNTARQMYPVSHQCGKSYQGNSIFPPIEETPHGVLGSRENGGKGQGAGSIWLKSAESREHEIRI